MNNARLGIIGAGNMGSGYIRLFRDGAIRNGELVAVCDIDQGKRERAKSLLPSIEVYEDYEEMLDRAGLDAVIITTPHYLHPPIAVKAMRKGLHVLSDKPAGVFTKQVRAMNEEARLHPELVFAIMFNQRTNCIYRKMKELVSSGELGEIKRVSWIITDWYRSQSYYDSGGWRATWKGEGGGVLLNQCPHQLDLLTWICGLPKRVRAFCHEGKWHDIEVEDDVTAYLEFPGGATGTFITTTADAPGVNRFEIVLTKGTVKCEDGKLSLYRLDQDEREYCYTAKEGFFGPSGGFVEVKTDGRNEQHPAVINAFIEKILGKGELIARGEEGINSLLLSNAMYLSAWTDSTVTIPFDEDMYLALLKRKIEESSLKEEKNV